MDLDRFIVNQPSVQQPDHWAHGKIVLAPREGLETDTVKVYFLTGKVSSAILFRNALIKTARYVPSQVEGRFEGQVD